MNRKIIIQCSGSKNPAKLFLGNREVSFVAKPECYEPAENAIFAHPDDLIPDQNRTWRGLVAGQETEEMGNSLRSADLYKPAIYGQLATQVGLKNLFILSAGWGLVRGDFLLPEYDITFNAQSGKGKRRRKGDLYEDFNQLDDRQADLIIFVGKDYLPLLYDLLDDHQGEKSIYFKSDRIPRRDGYNYLRFETKRSTNWHYEAASQLVINQTLMASH